MIMRKFFMIFLSSSNKRARVLRCKWHKRTIFSDGEPSSLMSKTIREPFLRGKLRPNLRLILVVCGRKGLSQFPFSPSSPAQVASPKGLTWTLSKPEVSELYRDSSCHGHQQGQHKRGCRAVMAFSSRLVQNTYKDGSGMGCGGALKVLKASSDWESGKSPFKWKAGCARNWTAHHWQGENKRVLL